MTLIRRPGTDMDHPIEIGTDSGYARAIIEMLTGAHAIIEALAVSGNAEAAFVLDGTGSRCTLTTLAGALDQARTWLRIARRNALREMGLPDS